MVAPVRKAKLIPLEFENRTVFVVAVEPLAAIPRIASAPAPPAGANIEIVMLPALVEPERVTLFDPTKRTWPVTRPVSPAVFP